MPLPMPTLPPLRSTVPLLTYWRHPAERWESLRLRLGLEVMDRITYSFEHPVNVIRGRGKPSYSDLMILATSVTVAIEAKYTEPPYEKVCDWLGEPADHNRFAVLTGWLDLLECACGTRVSLDGILQLSYQLVHRAASACSSEARDRAVVYQIFDNALGHYYRNQLEALRTLIPVSAIKLALHITPAKASDTYSRLIERWRSGERNMARHIRAALIDQGILTFTEESFEML
jgi:Domain of unknown function (DUF6946)